MEVKLISTTGLIPSDTAIGKCYDKGCHTDHEKLKSRMTRVANVSKHASTIEHTVYAFEINGVSRALLQELARHRIASYSVKSTRYTLKELKEEESFEKPFTDYVDDLKFFNITDARKKASKYLVMTGDDDVDRYSIYALENLRKVIQKGVKNDIAKFCLPESYKTDLVWTVNARALQNFIQLRTSKHALWEIRDLAYAVFKSIPEDHKFLFEEFVS